MGGWVGGWEEEVYRSLEKKQHTRNAVRERGGEEEEEEDG